MALMSAWVGFEIVPVVVVVEEEEDGARRSRRLPCALNRTGVNKVAGRVDYGGRLTERSLPPVRAVRALDTLRLLRSTLESRRTRALPRHDRRRFHCGKR